jgi:hypothetical protein
VPFAATTAALARPRFVRAALTAACGTALFAACGGDGGPDAAAFCEELRADSASVVNPPLATEADVAATLERYRDLGELAPEGVAEEWSALVLNLETASTVVPSDPESVQRAVAQAYATERSAVVVRDWLLDNCGIDLGPVTTIAPQGRPTPATQPPSTDPTATTAVLSTEPAG